MTDEMVQPAAASSPAPAPADPDLPGRWLAGLLAWNAMRAQLPDTPDTYVAIVRALLSAGRGAEADIVLGEATRRFHAVPELAIDFAALAEQRQDWTTALERWQHVRGAFQDRPAGHLRAGILLRKQFRRLDEADTVLADGAARFPQRSDIWSEYAGVAIDRKDRTEALRRFRAMSERFPTLPGPWRWIVNLLRDEGRLDEAEAEMNAAMVRFPDDATLLVDRAWLANARQAWEEAVVRWGAVRTALPDNVLGYWLAGSVLSLRLNRHEEAEALLSEGVARFPDHLDQAMDHARVCERRGDLAEALQRWLRLAERHPDNQTITGKIAQLRARMQPEAATA